MPVDLLRPEYFFLAFAGLWIGISITLAWIGGWTSLAQVYRLTESFEGDRRWFQSAQMRWRVNYGSCLIVGANAKGLYLAILFPFRIGHPPLFIPWGDISIRRKEGFLFNTLEFRFRRAPEIPLRVSERLGRRLAASAGNWWPGEKQASS